MSSFLIKILTNGHKIICELVYMHYSFHFAHFFKKLIWVYFMFYLPIWQPTPVFLPGESQGRRSLVGSHQWGRTELDTTEVT